MKFELTEAIEILSATPATLKALLSGLSPCWTRTEGRRDDWEAFDIVGHLINADETDWIPRARVILDQGEDRNFPPFDRYAQFETSDHKTLDHLLNDLERVRGEALEWLNMREISDRQLELEGIHPEFGSVKLRELLATWVVHDLTHIRQLSTVLARKYEVEVGPWKAYLSILK